MGLLEIDQVYVMVCCVQEKRTHTLDSEAKHEVKTGLMWVAV